MLRSEILALDARALLDMVAEKFGVRLAGLEDVGNLGEAWKIVEKLDHMGWAVDIRNMKGRKTVDALGFQDGGPVTVFARYGEDPDFSSVCEGICKTGLIILEETKTSAMQ
ncbi:hypothetical protein DPF_2467 [Desulfoplanes formicivorans]|uniref:Uncharacterized protein n=2 Tax=Desulfoplanes formicivorans TaxID=1592317 RepID=A0A194AKH1_9BACT|nr:hypothetical protein DPF_2467 [Desulfoplanes formicivorans]